MKVGVYAFAVRLLREQGAIFTQAYLMVHWDLDESDSAQLVDWARNQRYPHMMSTRQLVERKDS